MHGLTTLYAENQTLKIAHEYSYMKCVGHDCESL